MPVYQSAPWLEEAFAGLAAQTETDFEILAFYDESTDGTLVKLLEIKQREPRLRIFKKVPSLPETPVAVAAENGVVPVALPRGEFSGLNYGMQISQSPFIAIQHADDISLPERFASQLAFLENHPTFGLVATWVEEFSEKGPFPICPTPDPEEIRAESLIHGPLVHATSMFRRELVTNPWTPFPVEFGPSTDIAWQNIILERTQTSNLPQILYRKRHHQAQVSTVRGEEMQRISCQFAREKLKKLGHEATPDEINFHLHWPCVEKPLTSYRWARRLIQWNRQSGRYQEKALCKVLGSFWLSACRHHMPNPWLRAFYFLFNPMSRWIKPRLTQRLHWAWKLWKKDYVLSIWFQK
jgi:glycosyltransferase involved in cell wall biosynthesis